MVIILKNKFKILKNTLHSKKLKKILQCYVDYLKKILYNYEYVDF